jgi:pimeloyl-ACP methyl ester carboxylesterase
VNQINRLTIMQQLDDNSGQISEYKFLGLRGRYGHWQAKSSAAKRTFVIVYGQHASLERLSPIIELFRRYGDVYAADNPGFGGMEPSYKIKRRPDLKFFADHLGHFVNTYVPKNRRITFVGVSLGFQIITEALNKHQGIQLRTEQLISLMGCISHKEIRLPLSYKVPLVYLMALPVKTWLGSRIFKLLARESVIVFAYLISKPIQVKLRGLTIKQSIVYAKQQAQLWIINDARTHASTAWDLVYHNDLSSYRIGVPTVHLGVINDHVIDSGLVKKELVKVFKSVEIYDLALENHAPLDIDTEEDVRALMPKALAKLLETSDNTSQGRVS